MVTRSPKPLGRDRALSTLNGLIIILDVARDSCGFPPAQAAIASTSILIAMIKVRFLRLRPNASPIHIYSGLHGQ